MASKRAPAKTPAKTATQTTARPQSFTGNGRADITPDELRKLVSEAAYYRAKQRGFAPGHEVEDWVQAEAEVLRRIEGRPSR